MSNFGRKIFITGIDTNIGKTIVSAIFVEAFAASYWKPIQCGDLEQSDSTMVKKLCPNAQIHPEQFRFVNPLSPHAAAARENSPISLSAFQLPLTAQHMIVEGAGGPLAPLNASDYIIDIAAKYSLPTIVVTKHYLGSLNHSFLAIEALKRRNIPILGLVFNGEPHEEYRKFICDKTELPCLLEVKQEASWSHEKISAYAQSLREKNHELFT